mgnify:CR=1 FL=1
MGIFFHLIYWYWSMPTPHSNETFTDYIFEPVLECHFFGKDFLKNHVQLVFSWHVNFSIIPSLNNALQFIPFCASTSCSSLRRYFTLLSFDAATRERLVVVLRQPDSLFYSISRKIFYTIFDWHLWVIRWITIIVFQFFCFALEHLICFSSQYWINFE